MEIMRLEMGRVRCMALPGVEYINTISVEDYNYLRKSVGWNEIAPKQAQTGIKNSAYLVSAVYQGKTVGMARLVSDGGYVAIIVDVIVLPEFQGNGIGKTMLEIVMGYINAGIGEGEGVMINLMAAKGKEAFYRQFGFAERPNDKHGAGMTQRIHK